MRYGIHPFRLGVGRGRCCGIGCLEKRLQLVFWQIFLLRLGNCRIVVQCRGVGVEVFGLWDRGNRWRMIRICQGNLCFALKITPL